MPPPPPPPPRKASPQPTKEKPIWGTKSGYMVYKRRGIAPNDPSRQERDLFYVYAPGVVDMHLNILTDLEAAKNYINKTEGWATNRQQAPQNIAPPPPPRRKM